MPYAYEREPARPMKIEGSYSRNATKTPFRYGVDADNQCWLSFHSADPLRMVTSDQLLETLGELAKEVPPDQSDFDLVRGILFGEKLGEPEWRRLARAAGWSPPAG